MTPDYFRSNILQIRNFYELSQTELAYILGVSRAMIHTYESGIRKPGYLTRRLIEKRIGVSFADLCTKEIDTSKLPILVGKNTEQDEILPDSIVPRIQEAILSLKIRGVIKSQKEICECIGYNDQQLSGIIHKRLPLTEKFLDAFSWTYAVNKTYLLTGEGEVFISKENEVTNSVVIDPLDNEFSMFLLEKRREHGLTKAMLSHFSGKPLADIAAWEEGTQTASPETQADLYLYFKSLQK